MTKDDQSQPDNQKPNTGDTIIAEIGDDVQGAAVGKYILQIGTLTIPYWVIALILLVLLAILVFVAVPPIRIALTPAPPPEPMTAQLFNIAVTQFGELDANGRAQPSDDGARLSKWVMTKLTNEFDENLELFGTSDMMDLLLISDEFSNAYIDEGVLRGNTPAKRKDAAEKLADEINANMIIYGNLATDEGGDGDTKQLRLGFYIAPVYGDKVEQVVGHDSLGDAIPVGSLDVFGGATDAAKPLEKRAQALTGLTIGLIYDLLGEHEQALKILIALKKQLDEQEPWEDHQGKALLYYLTARQHLILEDIGEAKKAAEASLMARPGYSRAHIVLGSVFAKLAFDKMEATKEPEYEHTARALAEYKDAASSAEVENNELVAQTARIALGSAHLLTGQAAYLAGESDAAIEALDRGLLELDNIYSPLDASAQFRYLAQAHHLAGSIYFLKAAVHGRDGDTAARKDDLEAARDAYNRCIKLGERSPFDTTLQEKVIKQYCLPWFETSLEELAKVEEP